MKYEFKTVQSEEWGYVTQIIHQNQQVVAECRTREMAKKVARGLELESIERKSSVTLDSLSHKLDVLIAQCK